MKVLITLNDGPYGSERSYNGLRLAGSLEEWTAWTLEADQTLVF